MTRLRKMMLEELERLPALLITSDVIAAILHAAHIGGDRRKTPDTRGETL
jgi:hypothetical protein